MAESQTAFVARVSRRVDVAKDVAWVTLGPEALDGTFPEWSPGAHIDVILPSGLVRQYSLCGDPADRGALEIAVLRQESGRGGSIEFHDVLVEGASVTVDGPRNNFVFDSAPHYRFIGGGIGITPLVPMVRSAEAAGADWKLLYGGRTLGSMAWAAELAAEYGDRVELWPQDENGLLDLVGLLNDAPEGTLIYACGPEPMLAAVEATCEGRLAESLRLERFAPKPQEQIEETAFEVEIRSSGEVYTIEPGDSIYSVLEDVGEDVFAACQEGTCRTCETTVLAGIPLHRDSVLSAAERERCDKMMICVSRSKSPRLVLDL